MESFAVFALCVWFPLTIAMFAMMAPRKAAVVSLIGAWLFLPSLEIPISGFPNYSKATATTLGILAATFIFQSQRLLALRPKPLDIPILVLCFVPIPSTISNGLPLYDAFSLTLAQVVFWGFPYLVGRLYFGDVDGLRDLTLGIVAGAILYILPCLYEIRMSPLISAYIYGYMVHHIEVRFGGFRPKVFLTSGLELGMWMTAGSLIAWWLWRAKLLKRMMGLPFGELLLPALLLVTLLCKSSGALALLILGMISLWCSDRFKTKAFLILLILIPPSYCLARGSQLWQGTTLAQAIETWFDAERAESLDFRFRNENLLIERALERPLLGWAGYGRNLDVSLEKLMALKLQTRAVPDGLWIIFFGVSGIIGLIALLFTTLLPALLFVKHIPPAEWGTPRAAPLAVMSVMLTLYMIDNLANAMLNLIYIVSMGGLGTAVLSYKQQGIRSYSEESLDEQEAEPTVIDHNRVAARYADLGRSLANQGQFSEAKATWWRALHLSSSAAAAYPGNLAIKSSWADCCNDFAWFLVSKPDLHMDEVTEAVTLALQATEAFPTQSTYWNTLGVAYYRSGQAELAVSALHQSLMLQDDQGTAFDYFYLAMASSRLGQHDIARSWYEKGLYILQATPYQQPSLEHLRYEVSESLSSRSNQPWVI